MCKISVQRSLKFPFFCRYLVEFVLRGDVVAADRDDASIDSGFFDDSSEAAPEGIE